MGEEIFTFLRESKYSVSFITVGTVPTTNVKAKLKNSRQRHDRRVVQSCQKSSNKTPTTDVLPEPYPNFRLRHKFSMMVVGHSMSGKSYFVKELLERDRIEYEDHRKRPKIH